MVKESWSSTHLSGIFDRIFNTNPTLYLKEAEAFFDACCNFIKDDYKSFPPHDDARDHGMAVRLRMMVHDVGSQEFAPIAQIARAGESTSPTYVTSFMRDKLPDGRLVYTDAEGATAFSRQCYVMVPVPGENDWWVDNWLGGKSRILCASKQCVVKVLTIQDHEEELKPNHVYELYGAFAPCSEGDPAFHVVKYDLVDSPNAEIVQPKEEDFKKLLEMVSTAVGNLNAARYLLMNMVSGHICDDIDGPQEAFDTFLTLNLCGVENADDIVALYKQLMEKVIHIKLTPDLLSNTRFAPEKNHETDELLPGLLQASAGTVVVFDETHMPEGSPSVSERAQENLDAIGNLLKHQKVKYNYGFHHVAMRVNCPILVISKQRSRIISTPWKVALPGKVNLIENTATNLDTARSAIKIARGYLRKYDINNANMVRFEEGFISLVSQYGRNEAQELFQRRLAMSRLASAIAGVLQIEPISWNWVSEFEKEREETLEVLLPLPARPTRGPIINH